MYELQNLERYRNTGQKHFKSSEEPPPHHKHESLPDFEPYQNFNNMENTLVANQGNFVDLYGQKSHQLQP